MGGAGAVSTIVAITEAEAAAASTAEAA